MNENPNSVWEPETISHQDAESSIRIFHGTSRRAARYVTGATLVIALAGAFGLAAAPADAAAPVPTPGAAPAGAATQSAQTGWLRIGHFSPDTTGVDVQITALSGGAVLYSLDDVTYGQLSKYLSLNAGTYVIAMRPTGAMASSAPVISQSVDVKAGNSQTVAAYGKRKQLKLAVFDDNLSTPSSGDARIRLIQTSTTHKSINVSTSTGMPIAKAAPSGTATDYASVPAGPWTLDVSGSGTKNSTTVNLANGSVNTIIVLDNSSGGVSLSTVVDSASVGAAPVGGVQTGGGWLAEHCLTTTTSTSARATSSLTTFVSALPHRAATTGR